MLICRLFHESEYAHKARVAKLNSKLITAKYRTFKYFNLFNLLSEHVPSPRSSQTSSGAQLSCSHLVDEEKWAAEKLCTAAITHSQAQPTDPDAQMDLLQQQLHRKKKNWWGADTGTGIKNRSPVIKYVSSADYLTPFSEGPTSSFTKTLWHNIFSRPIFFARASFLFVMVYKVWRTKLRLFQGVLGKTNPILLYPIVWQCNQSGATNGGRGNKISQM